jgi:hypothetical protein
MERPSHKLIACLQRLEIVAVVASKSPDVDRWRALAVTLAVVAALAGGASATSSGTPDSAANVALCGEDCQHNQVLL